MLDHLSGWLREQRLAHGWSMAEMGRQLQQAARTSKDHTVPPAAVLTSYVRRWEAGKVGLTERYRLFYCAAFDISPDQFGSGQSPGNPAPDVSGSHGVAVGQNPRSRTAAGSHDRSGMPGSYRDIGAPCRDTDHPRWSASVGARATVTAVAEESRDFGEWADTSNIGDATLEEYAGHVRQLARDYEHGAPYPLLLDARRLRDRIFDRLRGHQRLSQTRDLYLTGAWACGLLAWMSGDMNFYSAASAHAWTAWVCAEHADHDGARAWVRATQSKLAYWDARYSESAQIAESGLRYPSPDSGQVMLGLFRARALARLGRGEDAAGALTAARSAMDRAGPDEVGGLWGVSEARYHGLASNAQLHRHDPAQVLTEAGQALTLFEAADPADRNYGAEAHTRVDLARARLMLRDLEGASAALRPVFTLAPEYRYEPITQELDRARQALAAPEFRDAVTARELQEEIEAYCRNSIVHELDD